MCVKPNALVLLAVVACAIAELWYSHVAYAQAPAEKAPPPSPVVAVPADFQPWWEQQIVAQLRPGPAPVRVDVNWLIAQTLMHSARVRAISDKALIAETGVFQASAAFDTTAFIDSKFNRISVPTGSTLDAGANATRLREGGWGHSTGLRRKNRHGGRFEVAQRIGTQFSNSVFFHPLDQGNSRLTLSYNQPLLNGAGQAYNTSLIVLAELDTHVAVNRMSSDLQDHLLEVTEAYWDLRKRRAAYLQKQLHLKRSAVILERLEKRQNFDSLSSQIARARAAVTARQTETIRTASEVLNTETRLRALVNSPELAATNDPELIPTQEASTASIRVDTQDALVTALSNRPEISIATQEIDAARVRLNVAKNELLPVLDVVLETYVSGLRGDYDIGQAYIDQFSVGEPSYTAGVFFEVPIHRRAAKAQHQRRQFELRQLTNQLQATTEMLRAEVLVAVREVETAYNELHTKFEAMRAAEADVGYLQRRWEMLPNDDQSASFLLEDLLDAQDRLSAEEVGFAEAESQYALSFIYLSRATGTLLRDGQIDLIHGSDGCLPVVLFEQSKIEGIGHTFESNTSTP